MGLPAPRIEERQAGARLRLVRGKGRKPSGRTRPRSRTSGGVGSELFKTFAFGLVVLTVLGVGRVALSAHATEVSMRSTELRRQIKDARWLDAARGIVDSGRAVILYLAGRTPAGAQASASHTASVAGDYEVARQLAEQAGVAVAGSLSEFRDLTRLAVALDGRFEKRAKKADAFFHLEHVLVQGTEGGFPEKVEDTGHSTPPWGRRRN